MSGQNFVDDEVKGKKQNKKSKVKRQRSLITDAKDNNDQVINYFILYLFFAWEFHVRGWN